MGQAFIEKILTKSVRSATGATHYTVGLQSQMHCQLSHLRGIVKELPARVKGRKANAWTIGANDAYADPVCASSKSKTLKTGTGLAMKEEESWSIDGSTG